MRPIGLLGFALATLHSSIATSAPCGARDWVRVDVKNDPQLTHELERLLSAELASRGIDVCTEGGPRAPLASVVIVTTDTGADLSVDVSDQVTQKRIGRDIPLSDVPKDSVALTLALAADELLRASWAELALKTHAPATVPPAVQRTLEDSLAPAEKRAPLGSFGAGFAFEHFSAGSTLYGPDVVFGFWLHPRVSLRAMLGLRSALDVATEHGTISTSVVIGGLSGAVSLTRPEGIAGLSALGRFNVDYVTFTPSNTLGATGTTQSDAAILGDVGLEGWFVLVGPLRGSVSVMASVPFRNVRATDGDVVVAGIGGFGIASAIRLWGTF